MPVCTTVQQRRMSYKRGRRTIFEVQPMFREKTASSIEVIVKSWKRAHENEASMLRSLICFE